MMIRDFLDYNVCTIGGFRQFRVVVDAGMSEDELYPPCFKLYDNYWMENACGVTRISFYRPEYIVQHGYPYMRYLTRNERKDLIKFLQSPSGYDKKYTKWQKLIYSWNDQNVRYLDYKKLDDFDFWEFVSDALMVSDGILRQYALPIDLPMPDYLKLKRN